MSKNQPQAPAKPNMMQNLLLLALVIIGFQLFFNKNNQADTRTVDQILQTMRDDNTAVKDLSIARELSALQNKLKN